MATNDAGTKVSQNVPVWLSKTFVDAVRGCGSDASAEQIDEKAHLLLDYWCASTRPYHNAAYLARVIAAIDELSDTAHTPDLLRAAIWYVGMIPPDAVVFDSPASSKFRESCPARISDSLQSLGVDDDTAERACELLSFVAERFAPLADVDASVLVDASMCDLASTPQEYKKYRQAMREEYPHLSTVQYMLARRRYIKTLLGRSSIYFSPAAVDWEPLARQNLEAELANIDASISKLDPSVLEDDEDEAGTLNQEMNPATSTLIIKKVGAKSSTERSTDPDAITESAPSAESAPLGDSRTASDSVSVDDYISSAESAPTAPSPAHGDAQDLTMMEDSGASSLEAEPEILAPVSKEPAHRLTAKELAREAAKKAKAEKEAEKATQKAAEKTTGKPTESSTSAPSAE
jgi:predicted metal-dependent HD superfamily phosphohydrolase